jgi:hypothetical protein
MTSARSGSGLRRGGIALLWLASMAAAAWMGGWFARRSEPAVVIDVPSRNAGPTSDAARAPLPVFIATGANGIDASEIRQIVREELAERLRPTAASSDAGPGEGPKAAHPPSPEAEIDTRKLSRLIERAVANGRWTPEDRKTFADVAASLSPPDVFDLRQRLIVAINRGQVAIADGLPPFAHFVPTP